MNSRQRAKTWPFPKHSVFVKLLRKSTSEWFSQKGFVTRQRTPYILSERAKWQNNIILNEVVQYIVNAKQRCGDKRKPFPLHKYLHHGLSSQAMGFNLVAPLVTRSNLAPLLNVLQEAGVNVTTKNLTATFEYEDRTVFNEDSGQPTSIDIVLEDDCETPFIFIESKFVEKEFGGCSVLSNGDCSGQNPSEYNDKCYLHHIGRKYWVLMEKYGFSEIVKKEKQCVFGNYYQYFREVLLTLEKNGTFVLLSDDRSPVFHCEIDGIEKGIMPFLLEFTPEKYKSRIVSISVQSLLKEIKKSGRHSDWVDEFELKYGLV